jgi:hypothetical protein
MIGKMPCPKRGDRVMSSNVTLKSYQVYRPPHELTNENVTISGSPSGKYDLDGQGSFKVVGPQVRGPGTLDLVVKI